MRRKVTLNLDERWIAEVDAARGDVPRSRFIERAVISSGAINVAMQSAPTPQPTRSPVTEAQPIGRAGMFLRATQR